jgi:hypothetical protein
VRAGRVARTLVLVVLGLAAATAAALALDALV